jgi:hypothetical protein
MGHSHFTTTFNAIGTNQEQLAVGLDIGTTKIVAIIGKKNEFGKCIR